MALSAILVDRTDNSFAFSAFDEQGVGGVSAYGDDYFPLIWAPYVTDSSGWIRWNGITEGVILSTTTDEYGPVYTYDTSVFATTGSYISGQTFLDQQTFLMVVCADTTSAILSSIVEYIPWRLTIVSQYLDVSSANLSAMFTDGTNNYYLNPDTQIKWTGSPNDDASLSALSAGGDQYYFIQGAATEISAITVFSNILTAGYDYNIDLTGEGDDSWRTLTTFPFGVNPLLEYSLIQTPTCAYANAFLNRGEEVPLDPTSQIVWTITPTDGLSSTIMTPGGPVALASQIGPDTVANLESITLRATSYNAIHYLTVSATPPDTPLYTGTPFIPYLDFVSTSTTYLTYTPIVQNQQTRSYRVQLKGITTGGVSHNLDPSLPIVWDDRGSGTIDARIGAVSGTGYTFLSDGGSLQLGQTVNPLYVLVSTTEWNGVGVPGVDTFTIYATAASGYNVPTDTISTAVTSLTSINWVPDSYFKPRFALNNELTSTTQLFREVSADYTLTVRDSSTVPTDLTVDNFYIRFSDGGYPLTASNFAVISAIDGSTPSTFTVNVTGEIARAGWPDVSIKSGVQKSVNFVGYFPSASAFIVYPEYKWNGTAFTAITADPETDSPGVCAFGYCHTENFYFSALDQPNTTHYWQIENITPLPISDTNPLARWPIPSTNTTATHSVSLTITTSSLPFTMPQFYRDDNTGVVTRYPNFSNTSEPSYRDTRLKNPIQRPSISDFGLVQVQTTYNPVGVSAVPLVLSGNFAASDQVPVKFSGSGSYAWTLTTPAWTYTTTQLTPVYGVNLTVSDEPTGNNEIPKFEPTIITVDLDLSTILITKDSLFADWCTTVQAFSSETQYITAYPLTPLVYTSNKYVLTGTNVLYQNLVPYFDSIVSFTWTDRGRTYVTNTASTYTTAYSGADRQNITLQTTFTGNFIETNTFSNIIFSLTEFPAFNSTITRNIGITKLSLPNSLQLCQVPPNEWCIADNINRSFDKLNENLTYLDQMSILYDSPPTEYFGWYGTLQEWNGGYKSRWRVNISGINYNYLNPQNAVAGIFTDARDIAVQSVAGIGDNITLISNSTAVMMLSSDFEGTEITRLEQKGIGDPFVQIEAIDVDQNFASDSRVYILDSVKNRVLVYQYSFTNSQWKLLYSWGGLGGQTARNKFRSPTGLLVDSTNKLWITDRENLCIKKFSRTGSWIQTITSDFFTIDNKPRSTAIADDGSIHVLCDRSIVKFTSSGIVIKEYGRTFLNGLTTRSITTCRDGGFFYIMTASKVLKISQEEVLIGSFGDELNVTNYKNLYHDQNRNVYLVSPYAIIKYIDKLDSLNLRLDTTGKTWPLSAVYIDEDEYVQDWVVNRSFARFYDNLEVFRRSIIGKFDRAVKNGVTVPVVRSFTPTEYREFPYRKKDVYVGLNEIVSAPVFNRCVNKLYSCLQTILEMIKD